MKGGDNMDVFLDTPKPKKKRGRKKTDPFKIKLVEGPSKKELKEKERLEKIKKAQVLLKVNEYENVETLETPKIFTDILLSKEKVGDRVLEPACGLGGISKVLVQNGHRVRSTDLVYAEYGDDEMSFFDYVSWDGDIICEPPPEEFVEFVEHAFKILKNKNQRVMMLVPPRTLINQESLFIFKKYPPLRIWAGLPRDQGDRIWIVWYFKCSSPTGMCWI